MRDACSREVRGGLEHVARLVEQLGDHQRALHRRDHHLGLVRSVERRLQLAALHSLLDDVARVAHHALHAGARALAQLRVRRPLRIIALHRRVEQRASPFHRRPLGDARDRLAERGEAGDRGGVLVDEGADALAVLLDRVVEGGERELVLALEVAIDAALLEAGGGHEVGHAGADVSALVEQRRGRGDNAGAGALALGGGGNWDML